MTQSHSNASPRLTYSSILPLDKEHSGYSRHISFSSCRLDADHLQVRGELVDSRADYNNPELTVPVHGIVVRLTVQINGLVITDARIELPKMAFDDLCRQVPHSGEPLVGLSIKKNFLQKVEDIYGGDRSCFHLFSLLSAMIPAFTQVRHWNDSFPAMDQHMSADAVPVAMDIMTNSVQNTCYAWRSDGVVVHEIREGHYDRLLKRVSPSLLQRWHDKQRDEADKKG